MVRNPDVRLFAVPLARDSLKRVPGLDRDGALIGLALQIRIDSIVQQLSGIVAFAARLLDRPVGIGPECERFFFSREALLPSPPLAAGCLHFDVKAGASDRMSALTSPAVGRLLAVIMDRRVQSYATIQERLSSSVQVRISP